MRTTQPRTGEPWWFTPSPGLYPIGTCRDFTSFPPGAADVSETYPDDEYPMVRYIGVDESHAHLVHRYRSFSAGVEELVGMRGAP